WHLPKRVAEKKAVTGLPSQGLGAWALQRLEQPTCLGSRRRLATAAAVEEDLVKADPRRQQVAVCQAHEEYTEFLVGRLVETPHILGEELHLQPQLPADYPVTL